ncbi:MAG: UvrD-helicase domain-containing protein, partial [Lachnospiraceae bacterium]|nr:UvrD-helicase domain-containing protein [Lachnospiraceae bacterium]
MTDFEKELNDRQLEAVKTTDGPVLILAGAGSGKTRVLTYRTAYLIDEAKVKPWNIIALTFTNKAAREMKERIGKMTGDAAKDIWVSTFHSTCLRIMFSHAEKLGYRPNFEVADASDQKSVIKDVMKKLNVDT